MKKLFCGLLLLALTGCGIQLGQPTSNTVSRTASLAGQSVRLVSKDGALTTSGSSLSGTGASIYQTPLTTITTGTGYQLNFSLPQDGASLTLVSHADANLAGGFEIEFLRQGFGPGSLKVLLIAGNVARPATDVFGRNYFQIMDASMPLSFAIDVLNQYANAARVLVWSPQISGNNFNAGAALLDTANNAKGVRSPGKGTGKQWGLILNQATVNSATTGASY